ncbi:unnamed protein product [Acanthoscelides obtectus]|uniref:Uncharacterized protein n=1 Tax=Acanthoscelides obtectus TaxID=200917 RepID=A0A9P0NQB0_ACAOB|nr:unnamed protein product [Acanthoscelides obtectus]CAK1678635.1 hypothetical protein AOBTE_LOCUS31976 [Acanthoscelides obtectus]
MDSSSEFSSESDPYHDSDNYDMDPDYVLESESGNKNGRKCFIKSLSNAYSVTDQHALNDDKEQDEEINKASTSGINQTPISKHVTAGDNSSSSTEEDEPAEKHLIKEGKKRQRTPQAWKRNVRKLERNSGKEYKSSGGKTIEAKQQGFRCDCRKKCFEKFTEMEKDAIFTEFYAMGDKNIQDSYLAALIDVKKVSRRRKTSVGEKKIFLWL